MMIISPNQEVTWKARVIDAETGLPVEGVHIFYQRDQSVSDSQGFFLLALEENVTVKISHIGYEVLDLELNIENLPTKVFIYPKESNLDLIEVRPLPSEAEFKRRILSTPVYRSQSEVSIMKSKALMMSVYKYIPSAGKGGFAQFLERAIPNGAGGAMFFNSSGGGLLQVFRELKQDYKIPESPSFTEVDSAKVDQLYKSKSPLNRKNN
ncbi:carboxypeptidase-like regulatory domain-containing protein [Belliella aquatica]|nr:hypothetical protein [Belliella aquatica]